MADSLRVVVTPDFEESPRHVGGPMEGELSRRAGSRFEDSPLDRLRCGSSRTHSWRTPSTSPRAAAEAAVAQAVSELVTSHASLGPQDGCGPRVRISFRFAVISAIVVAVLLSCLGMFMPLEVFTNRIQRKTTSACEKAVDVQRNLISELINFNVTKDAYTSLLGSLDIMVQRFVKDPSDQAVDALWGEMRTYNKFDPGFTGKGSADQRAALAFHSWVELSTQWTTKKGIVVDFGPYTAPEEWRAHPYSLYVGFDTEQFAGVLVKPSVDRDSPAFQYLDAQGGTRDRTNEVSLYSTEGGVRLEPAFQVLPYPTTKRPYYEVQARIAEEAMANPAGPKATKATRAWSKIYNFSDGSLGTSWTAPVAFCGDYSCFGGVVAADVTLDYVNFDCWRQWSGLQRLLETHHFTVSDENSSIFIVNHVAERFPEQEGLLVGSSNMSLAMSGSGLTKADSSPQAVVRRTSQAILKKFKRWNAKDLRKEVTFTFRPSQIEAQGFPVGCDESARNVRRRDPDCLQVGTYSVQLDNKTRWLVVATFPVGAFATKAAQVDLDVIAKVDEIVAQSELVVKKARQFGLGIFLGMTVLSIVVGAVLGFLVSRPLRRLSKLMRRLGDLDFAHETREFMELRSGRRSRISDVGKLQGTFCSLSRGIEAFARFVPETVVRNIVRGDPTSTQLSVSRREATIMFSDIRDFTKIAEDLQLRDLLLVLTRYLSVMTRIVELFEGVVAEILGDGLLVFWNTPDDVEDHPAKACAAALAQQQALVLLNNELQKLELPLLSIRIGLNTGSVLSGNIGSDAKMKFGCLGDPVNLANHLEGLCKFYGVGVICNETTYKALPQNAGFFCRRLDLIQVKDNTEPTTIYEVVGREFNGARDDGGMMTPHPAGPTPGPRSAASDEVDEEAGTVTRKCSDGSRSLGGERSDRTSKSSRTSGDTNQREAGRSLWRVVSGVMSWQQKQQDAPHRTASSANLSLADAATAAVEAVPAMEDASPSPSHGHAPQNRSRDIVTAEQRLRASLYEAALTAYQEARFEAAHESVQRLLVRDPQDAAAENLGKRIARYREGAEVFTPEQRAAWTGVHLLDR